jgi:glycosyltransferase involved in cell wall biosynthesis
MLRRKGFAQIPLGKCLFIMGNSLKLGILVSHPIQYFVPVYRELAKTAGVDLRVLFRTRVGVDDYFDEGFGQIVKWDIPLLSGYHYDFLSSKTRIQGVEWGIIGALFRNRLDVLVVHGYNNVTNLLAILIGKMLGTKILMRGDTRLQARHEYTGWKSLFKRAIFKLCNGFLAIGELNRAYYAHFGAPAKRLFFAPFCVSTEQFALSPETRIRERTCVRTALQVPADAGLVLFAGKLIKLKRADDLIRAFALLADDFPTIVLVIAGSGEERLDLERLAADLRLERIRFVGFQNQSQLPALYAAADLFVLPSDNESWGLVINEVMAAGLPVIVSSEVGSAPDLVSGKGTGIIFQCGDIEALSQSMRSILSSPDLRASMGANGKKLIEQWDVAACAQGIARAAFDVASHGKDHSQCVN